jgi:hypothetical protein
MKKRKTLRVPRKLKKECKNSWKKNHKEIWKSEKVKLFMVKSSIAKTTSWQETLTPVWGAEVRFKTKKS